MKQMIVVFIITLCLSVPSQFVFAGKGKGSYGKGKGGSFDGDMRGLDGTANAMMDDDPDDQFGFDPFETPPPVTDEEKKHSGGHVPPVIDTDVVPPPVTEDEKKHDGGHVPAPVENPNPDRGAQAVIADVVSNTFQKFDPTPMTLETGGAKSDHIMDQIHQPEMFPGATKPFEGGGTYWQDLAASRQATWNKGKPLDGKPDLQQNIPGSKQQGSSSGSSGGTSDGSQVGPGTDTGGPGGDQSGSGSKPETRNPNATPWQLFNSGQITEQEYRELENQRTRTDPRLKDPVGIQRPQDQDSSSGGSSDDPNKPSIIDEIHGAMPIA